LTIYFQTSPIGNLQKESSPNGLINAVIIEPVFVWIY
jgi:hypothetical protein